ncbi:MAG: M28 family metallopeptidase [bacterium]
MRFFPSLLVIVFIFLPHFILGQDNQFNADSAYVYVQHLAVTIGPRPMGSKNERLALRWTADRFNGFGADTAYVMPVSRAGSINTTSGVAVGVFSGESDSAIVIGGHIDSDSHENPGANDDASGVGCVIELARIWGSRPKRYTLVFTAFGGEEQGLIGARHFVERYPEIGKVALMLQIDMAGDEADLFAVIDPVGRANTSDRQTPLWLIRDAFEIDRRLGFNALDYPTHFFSLSNALGGIVSSDHVAFQNKGIPAIDFTAGVNTSPIHTPQDRFDFIRKDALARSGRLVDGLLAKYNSERIPQEVNGEYMLVKVLWWRIYLPAGAIVGVNISALLLGLLALLYSRWHRARIPKEDRDRFTGMKFFFLLVLVAVFTQLGEAAMQLIKGVRYPWVAPFYPYLGLAAICATAGGWVAMWLCKRLQLSPDPYVYTKRALSLLVLFGLLLSLVNPRTSFYVSVSLLLLSFAIVLPFSKLKCLLILITPWPMSRLMFMEALPFLRSTIEAGFDINTFFQSLFYSVMLTAILVLWYLPSIYAFGYAAVTILPFKNAVKRFRGPLPGLAILLILLGYSVYVFSLAPYNDRWRASLVAEARYDVRSGESSFELRGNEYFRKVEVATDSMRVRYDRRILNAELPVSIQANWLRFSGQEAYENLEDSVLVINWRLETSRPWYEVRLLLRPDEHDIELLDSDLAFRRTRNGVEFVWKYEPSDTLTIQARLKVPPGVSLIREVDAIYSHLPFAAHITAKYADVRYRTTVSIRDTLRIPVAEFTDAERR